MAKQPPRSPGARAMYPNHPSALTELDNAPARSVRGEPPGNPATRLYQHLKSSGYSRGPQPGEQEKPYWVPRTAPRAFRKRGK
jgi:hypothetical protein